MSEDTPTTSRQQLLEPQNSFERNVAEITRQSMQSFDEDSPAPKRKTMLRREGTFSIYDSGKKGYLFNSKVWVKKKQDTLKNWPLVKNQQFFSNPNETWWKWLSHEAIIFTKFHEDWTKIVDFLLMAKFWTCLVFFYSDLRMFYNMWKYDTMKVQLY